MWCPKCKNEYRVGITTCADCKIPLIDSIDDLNTDDMKLVQLTSKEDAQKLVQYLEYSGIRSHYEENDVDTFDIFVKVTDAKKAQKAFAAFFSVELASRRSSSQTVNKAAPSSPDSSENTACEADASDDAKSCSDPVDSSMTASPSETASSSEAQTEPDNSASCPKCTKSAGVYVSKKEKTADYRSSAFTFTGFGIIGLIVMLLHWCGVIHYFNIVSAVMLTVVFLGFLLLGLDSFRRASRSRQEEAEEASLSRELTDWLDANLTLDFLERVDDPNNTDELNFLNRMAAMKFLLQKKFGELDQGFLDQFTEDYYNNHFE